MPLSKTRYGLMSHEFTGSKDGVSLPGHNDPPTGHNATSPTSLLSNFCLSWCAGNCIARRKTTKTFLSILHFFPSLSYTLVQSRRLGEYQQLTILWDISRRHGIHDETRS